MKQFLSRSDSTHIRNVPPGVEPGLERRLRVYVSGPGRLNVQVRSLRGKTPAFANAALLEDDVRALRDYLTSVLHAWGRS